MVYASATHSNGANRKAGDATMPSIAGLSHDGVLGLRLKQ